jgi:hypothetical protein
MAVMKDLFGAYRNNELPVEGGYIVSSFFDDTSAYTRFEVTSYNNVKDIFASDEGLTFQADGRKIFVIVEPANYSNKHIEPAYRDAMHKAPYRFSEMEILTTGRQDKIMYGREPVMTYGSFTILKTRGHNFSYIFYSGDSLVPSFKSFLEDSIWKDCRVPKHDAEKAAAQVTTLFEKIVNPPAS